MNELTDDTIFGGSVDHKFVESNLQGVVFASILAAALSLIFGILFLDDVPWLVVVRIIICVLAAHELSEWLHVLPDDLITLIVRFQFPKDDLVIIFADGDEACVIVKPVDLAHRAIVSTEDAVLDPRVLPERKDLNTVFVIVERVHVSSIRELNLCATTDIVMLEVSWCNIIGMHRIDLDSIKMANDKVET